MFIWIGERLTPIAIDEILSLNPAKRIVRHDSHRHAIHLPCTPARNLVTSWQVVRGKLTPRDGAGSWRRIPQMRSGTAGSTPQAVFESIDPWQSRLSAELNSGLSVFRPALYIRPANGLVV